MELAEEVGYSSAAVRYQRRIRGIPPFSDRQADKTYEWSDDEDAVLGTMSDAAVARLLAISEGMVSIRRKALGIPPSTEPLEPTPVVPHLGKVSDISLAKHFCINHATIMKWRRARGIPPYREYDWADWDHLLGTDYDQVVADRLGVCAKTVMHRRKVLGIPPKRWSTKPKRR